MRLATIAIFISLLQAPVTPPTGGIDGIVTRAGTGEPIAGAEVILTSSLYPNGFNGPSPIPAGTTNPDGSFSFRNLPPATYRVAVTSNGYVRGEYGKLALYGTGKSVYLGAGQTVKDISIALTPAATVTGRILDDKGQPATDVLVQLVEESYGPQGRSFRGAGMANANDRGDFRMYGITPGRYYLVAGSVMVLQTPQPGAGDVMMIQTSRISYAPTFYPGVPEMSAASLVELKPDSQIQVSLTVNRPMGYRVSGRVVDSATGQAATDARINLSSLLSPQMAIQPMLSGMRNTGTGAGTFEFLNVPPGDWAVRAEIPVPVQPTQGPPDPATSAARNAAQARRPLANIAVHVTNGNIEGLMVTLDRGFSVPARIRLDGAPLSALPNMDRISIRFQPSENGILTQTTIGNSPTPTRPGPDGAFQLDGVRAGEFLMSVNGIPPGFYVKTARYAGEDVLYPPIRFTTPGSEAIELVFHSGAAQISGTVTDSKSQPVSGIQAVLIPDPARRNRTELFRTALTDQNGHFIFPNVAPGDYKAFSWEAIQQGAYYNSAAMKQFEAQGRPVHVEESSNENIDMKMIPVAE